MLLTMKEGEQAPESWRDEIPIQSECGIFINACYRIIVLIYYDTIEELNEIPFSTFKLLQLP